MRSRMGFVLSFIMAVCLLLTASVHAENATWDCPNPECGRKGNIGEFCGGCGEPSPDPEQASEPEPAFGPENTLTPTPTPTPEPTAEPTMVPKPELTPEPAFDPKEQIPVLSELYPGSEEKLKSNNDRWYAKYGPGKEYAKGASAGGYKADGKHSNRLTLYFCENGWVYANIVYSTSFERYAYLPKHAVNDISAVPEIAELESVDGVTVTETIPSWGPNTVFERNPDCKISADTRIKAFFTEGDFVYAEFSCGIGTVRMWLPLENVSFD